MFCLPDNPIITIFVYFNMLMALIGFFDNYRGVLWLLIIIPFTDFIKRLSFLFPISSPSELNLVVGAPDLIIISIYSRILLSIFVKKTSISNLKTAEGKLILVFFLWSILKVFWSNTTIMSNLVTAKLWVMYIPLFFIGPLIFDSEEKIKKAVSIIIFCAFITGLYGILQGFSGLNEFEKRWSESGYSVLSSEVYLMFGILRPFSTFSNIDSFSYYLIFALVLIYLLSLKKSISNVIIPVLIAGLIISLYRSGILLYALIIGLLWFLSRNIKSCLKKLFIIGLSLISVFALNYLSPLFSNILETQATFQSQHLTRAITVGTYSDRVAGRERLISNWGVKNIFGRGLSSSQNGATASNRLGKDNSEYIYTHDLASEQIVTIGIVGFALFFIAICIFAANSITAITILKNGFWYHFILRISVLVIGLVIIGYLSNGSFLLARPIIIIFWSFMGIASLKSNHITKKESMLKEEFEQPKKYVCFRD